MAKQLDENDRWTLINGMRVAAEKYDADALVLDEAAQPRVADQFRGQAEEARRLSQVIEAEEELVISG